GRGRGRGRWRCAASDSVLTRGPGSVGVGRGLDLVRVGRRAGGVGFLVRALTGRRERDGLAMSAAPQRLPCEAVVAKRNFDSSARRSTDLTPPSFSPLITHVG